MKMSETIRSIQEFERNQLRALLIQCTDEQIKFFNRLYGSIETITQEKTLTAIRQCERTIALNAEKGGTNHE